jgi:hypothetical protein
MVKQFISFLPKKEFLKVHRWKGKKIFKKLLFSSQEIHPVLFRSNQSYYYWFLGY